MNKMIVFFWAVVILASCTNQPVNKNQYTINGTIDGDSSGIVYLFKRESGKWVKLDSAQVENNKFKFSNTLDFPEMYYISIKGENKFAPIFVEPSEITFKTSYDNFRSAEITGSEAQTEYDSLQSKLGMFDEMFSNAWNKIKEARNKDDKEAEDKWQKEYDNIDAQMKQFILDNAMTNNKSVVAAYAVLRHAYYYDEKDLEPIVNNFDPSIKDSPYVKQLSDRVETLKRVAVGQPAVDFTMTDTAGNPVELSSLFGKYLLVDFWASWCGPCRRENPNVVATYNQYHDKGFDILGVSFDESKDKWIKAIKDDGLVWHQVSDLKGWGNEAGKLYAINSIPANVLLDPSGKIIAKNLSGDDLKDKLSEVIGK